MKSNIRFKRLASLFFIISILSSCTDFIVIDPPRTDLTRSTVFASDETARAAMADIYYQLSNTGFAGGNVNSVTSLAALSSDDIVNGITWDLSYREFSDNKILPTNSLILALWSDLYSCIYKANAVIEGVAASSAMSNEMKLHLVSEAKFVRAFCHFYLVNLFGDVPLVLSTDYEINQNIARIESTLIYEQIVADLLDAKEILPEDFSVSDGERVRANKGAATALLARVYMFSQEWAKAETEATAVISNPIYSLTTLEGVFLKNSTESILQLLPVHGNAGDVHTYTDYGHQVSPELSAAVEANDQRGVVWMNTGMVSKYKSIDNSFAEYTVVFRLAEQYLIRAEARASLDNIDGAREDLNVIRSRAGLGDTPANDKASLKAAVEQERRIELFGEWGHRWLDLKRTERIDGVLDSVKPDYVPTSSLYPIPEAQILSDPAMSNAQNPGY